MVNPKLIKVCEIVAEWCVNKHIKFDLVCDETDLQGFMLFKRNRDTLSELFEYLKPITDVHFEMRKVRGGNILAFSLKAISEDQIDKILAEAGEEEIAMTFKERVSDAFTTPPIMVAEQEEQEPNFLETAQKIAESQRKSATGGMTRSNQTTHQRQQHGSDTTTGGVEHGASARTQERAVATPTNDDQPLEAQTAKGAAKSGTHGVSKGSPLRFENKIRSAMDLPILARLSEFDVSLNETLQGMATPDNQQPGDLFNQFARALQVLGQQMGVGPLQDQLKEQGIQWKKSDDGLSIILYIQNARTNAPQPIARITSETLANPRDFEDQLTNMLDFAKGEAPGTLRQKQQELKDQEGAIRDIAQAISPEDQESEVAKQMNQPQVGAAPAPADPAPAPAVPAPASAAAPQAATQAAAPKLAAGKIRKRSGLV